MDERGSRWGAGLRLAVVAVSALACLASPRPRTTPPRIPPSIEGVCSGGIELVQTWTAERFDVGMQFDRRCEPILASARFLVQGAEPIASTYSMVEPTRIGLHFGAVPAYGTLELVFHSREVPDARVTYLVPLERGVLGWPKPVREPPGAAP